MSFNIFQFAAHIYCRNLLTDQYELFLYMKIFFSEFRFEIAIIFPFLVPKDLLFPYMLLLLLFLDLKVFFFFEEKHYESNYFAYFGTQEPLIF